MNLLIDILSYVVFTGFMFAAICAMTRGGRGWCRRVVALGALVAVDVAVEQCWQLGKMPFDLWLAVCFCAKGGVLTACVFFLSRDPTGRRLFLSIVYCAYAACYASVFHLFAYRDVFGLSEEWRAVIGLGFVVAANLAFIYLVLPCVPRGDRALRWRDPCLGAGVLLMHLFGTGIWPVSVVSASGRNCLLFALASATAWVVFPLLCHAMRMRLINVEIAHNLDMMVAEVKERRSALDEARRLRHDQRHHRIVIADMLLRDRPKEALAYVNALDREGWALAGTTDVWCRNETVNAILSGAARKAAELGVGFSAEAHVERASPLPDVELVSLVANLVENAVCACGEVEGCGSTAEQGKVCVTLRQRGDMFGITVTNPVPDGFALSSAGWPCAEWGVGLASVGRIVAKYRGEWRYRLEGGLLTCSAVVCAGEER